MVLYFYKFVHWPQGRLIFLAKKTCILRDAMLLNTRVLASFEISSFQGKFCLPSARLIRAHKEEDDLTEFLLAQRSLGMHSTKVTMGDSLY